MKILTVCKEGLETVCGKEAYEITRKKADCRKGAVIIDGVGPEKAIEYAYRTQSAHRIIELLYEESNYETFMKNLPKAEKGKSYRVRCIRVGEHPFTSLDLEQAAGKKLYSKGMSVDLDNPDIPYLVYVNENDYYFGIDLTCSDISKRPYNIFVNPGAVKATVAYSLVRLSGYKRGDVMVDPFCRSGTICIEAALYSRRYPPYFFNKDQIKFPNTREYEDSRKIFEKIDKGIVKEDENINAIDSIMPNIKAAEKNSKIAGVNKDIKFSRTEVSWLDTKFDKKQVDRIVSVYPVSSKTNSKSKIDKLYRELFYQGDFVLSDNGTICILTKEDELVKKYAKMHKFKIKEKLDLMLGEQAVRIYIIIRQ
ncbi:hypothetical protein K9M79_07030 [Candidatus Woesearchaeota archaeon]|nr:hypothetical protein [Candidatus Woesearchaeota archaeon]